MYNFLLNLVLYQIVPRRYKQDYLIVLGAGLIDGKKFHDFLAQELTVQLPFLINNMIKATSALN